MQLEDCRLERRDKEPIALTSNETKPIERIECIGNLEINIDREVYGWKDTTQDSIERVEENIWELSKLILQYEAARFDR